jgi:hypothetical protein
MKFLSWKMLHAMPGWLGRVTANDKLILPAERNVKAQP